MKRNYRILIALLLIFSTMLFIPPLDFKNYVHAARVWYNENTLLYTEHTQEFFYLPWSMALLAPLALFPDRIGQAIFNTGVIFFLLWAINVIGVKKKTYIAIALLTPFTVILFLLGQWDGLIIGVAILAWFAINNNRPWLLGLATILLATKPTNVILVFVVLMLHIRNIRIKDIIYASILPLFTILSSFFIAGTNWIQRYMHFLQKYPAKGFNISIWNTGLPFIVISFIVILIILYIIYISLRIGINHRNISLAMIGSLLLSPYVIPYHLIALSPALGIIINHKFKLGIWLWLSTWLVFILFALNAPFLAWWFTALEIAFIVVLSSFKDEISSQHNPETNHLPATSSDLPNYHP